LTGKTVGELVAEFEELGNDLFYTRLDQDVLNRPFKIKARVVVDDYRGTIALQLNDAEPVDMAAEVEAIKERIKTTV
jgi:hypothetical protein